MSPTNRTSPDLQALVDLFYESIDELGRFEEVDSTSLPEVYRKLLVHDEHMTVTVEGHHGCPVHLHVLQTRVSGNHYARQIVLMRQSDGRVVQFGIVRLNLDYLGPEVRRQIESEHVPLGRVLIEHDVLCTVRLLSLWRIIPGSDLRQLFGLQGPAICYGRTALIYCHGVIALELLEIIAPE